VSTPRHVIFGTGAIGLATRPSHSRRRCRLPDDGPALRGVDGPVPSSADRRARRRRGRRRPDGQLGERLRVRAPSRAPAHRRSRPQRTHNKGKTARRDVARASRSPPSRARRGRDRASVGLLRTRGAAQSNLGDRVFPAALAGETATVLGNPDQPHTYTYLPDIDEGLAVLGEHPDAPGEVWHLPNDPDTRTSRQLVETTYHLTGQNRAKLRTIPPLLLRALALTNPTIPRDLPPQHT
jgi:hypothetical protein